MADAKLFALWRNICNELLKVMRNESFILLSALKLFSFVQKKYFDIFAFGQNTAQAFGFRLFVEPADTLWIVQMSICV